MRGKNVDLGHNIAVMAAMSITTSQAQGAIPSGAEIANLINLDIDPKTGKKRDHTADTVALIKQLQGMQNDLHDLFMQIEDKMNDFKISRDRQGRMARAEINGDFDKLRRIFIDEYDMDATAVQAMSHDELREQRIKFDDLEQQNQAVIIAEIRDLAQDYKDRAKALNEHRPDLAQEELDKLDVIKYKCAAMGLSFEKLFSDTVQDEHNDFQTAKLDHEERDNSSSLNHKFNKVAPPDISNNPLLSNKNQGDALFVRR